MNVDPSAATAAEPNAASAASRAPESIGKYRLDRTLGTGGMGVVWAAFDTDLQRPVALKLLHAENANTTQRSRLLREAIAMARLRHPNVVTVYDVGTVNGRDYIAMELVEGGTLDAWLATRPPRKDIVEALLAAGRGLAAAHAAGLVHRDFKPHNVLRSTDGHVYVTDFGLARGQLEAGPEPLQIAVPLDEPISTSHPRPRRDPVLDSPLTQTGVLIGTPAYMAPEQFAGEAADPRVDQFAFCVTAWQALTGERPFRGASVAELEAAVRAGTRHLVVDLPAPLRAVLERGLDPSPAQRWPDMPTLLTALSAAVEGPAPRGLSRRWIATLSAMVLVGGVVAVVTLAGGRSEDDDGCVPADRAFAAAWGPERKAQLQARYGTEALGPTIVLDELRRRWIRSYTTACDAPRTPAHEERIHCLLSVRDDVATTVKSLLQASEDLEDLEIDVNAVGAVAAKVIFCDPAALRGGPGLLGW